MNKITYGFVYFSWLYLFVLFNTHSSPHYNLESGNYFGDAGTEYQWSDTNLVHYYNFFLKPLKL